MSERNGAAIVSHMSNTQLPLTASGTIMKKQLGVIALGFGLLLSMATASLAQGAGGAAGGGSAGGAAGTSGSAGSSGTGGPNIGGGGIGASSGNGAATGINNSAGTEGTAGTTNSPMSTPNGTTGR
jgi:hypothetical protein